MKRSILSMLSLLSMCLFLSTAVTAQTASDKNIVELASGNEDLSTLVQAIQSAGLVDALSADGAYTVFAPTNAAFEELPAGLLEALLLPENKNSLTEILAHHVIQSKIPAADVMAGIEAASDGQFMGTTMNGDLTLMTSGGNVMIKDQQDRTATVTATDVMASNGVVHLINKVLLPRGIDAKALMSGAAKSATNRMGQEMDDVNEDMDDMARDAEDKMDGMQEDMSDMARDAEETMDGVKEDMSDMARDAESDMDDMRTSSTTMSSGGSGNRPMLNNDGTVKNSIVDVASGNEDFSTLVGAVGKAGLAETFSTQGEYTVFAPSNDAFDKLPDGAVDGMSESDLQGVLKYHVLPFKLSSEQLLAQIEANKGYYLMPTVSGSTLVASMEGGQVVITDGNGGQSTITAVDAEAGNGVIHGIDTVLMDKKM